MNNNSDIKRYILNFILPDIILVILCVFVSYRYEKVFDLDTINSIDSSDYLGYLIYYLLVLPNVFRVCVPVLAVFVPIFEVAGFRIYLGNEKYFHLMNKHALIQIIVSSAAAVFLTVFFSDIISDFIHEVSFYGFNGFLLILWKPEWWKYFYPMILVISNLIGAIMLKRSVRKKQTEIFDRVKLNDKP